MAKKRSLTDMTLAKSLFREADRAGVDYHEALKTPLAETTDPLYREVIALHNALTARQQKALVGFARQAFIDGVSTVLGVLDGTTQADRQGFWDLNLTHGARKKKLNGYLQDYFLEAVELSARAPGRRAR